MGQLQLAGTLGRVSGSADLSWPWWVSEAVGLVEALALYPVPCPRLLGYLAFRFLPGHTIDKRLVNLRVDLRRHP